MRRDFYQTKDFHVGEEEIILNEIHKLRKIVIDNRNNENMSYKDRVEAETLLKRKEERLYHIRQLRENFSFEKDLSDTKSDLPIDQLLRDKIKDENFKGYLRKEEAEKMINKIGYPQN